MPCDIPPKSIHFTHSDKSSLFVYSLGRAPSNLVKIEGYMIYYTLYIIRKQIEDTKAAETFHTTTWIWNSAWRDGEAQQLQLAMIKSLSMRNNLKEAQIWSSLARDLGAMSWRLSLVKEKNIKKV